MFIYMEDILFERAIVFFPLQYSKNLFDTYPQVVCQWCRELTDVDTQSGYFANSFCKRCSKGVIYQTHVENGECDLFEFYPFFILRKIGLNGGDIKDWFSTRDIFNDNTINVEQHGEILTRLFTAYGEPVNSFSFDKNPKYDYEICECKGRDGQVVYIHVLCPS